MRRGWVIVAGAVVCGAMVFGLSWWLIDPHLERADEYPGGVVLRDNAGKVLRVSLGPDDADCRPYYVASKEDWIVKALVSAEDRRFFEHAGVNLPSVVRAAFQNVTSLRRVSGASTITMQATRLIHPHPRTLAWKYVEAFRAMQTERAHDKLWIISQYLNRAPFGSNLVGVEAAAQGWFGKRAKDLGIGEAALLAGMVQCPTRFRPDRHLDRALQRRAYVLGRMRALGVITPEQYEGAAASVPEIRRAPRPFAEPFFCDWAAARVARMGERSPRRGDPTMRPPRRGDPTSGDYETTLDADVQARATTLVNRAAANGYSAAAVVMRVDTAAVLALACSGDYFSPDAGQVNTALAPRPAGSTLKPFLTAAAMDCGFVTPEERLADVPKAYHGYTPANFSATHRGSVKLSDALVLSLNLPFVQLLQRLGVPRFGSVLRALGCRHLGGSDEKYGLGLAIGNAEVSLVELVGAYGCLARGGTWLEPCALAREAEAQKGVAPPRVFSPGACWLVSDILSGDQRSLRALGHAADVKVPRFAWKTGTSSGYRDAWTVAWNPEYVVGFWCGHKEGGFGDMSVVGAVAAAPFAWELARGLYPGNEGPWFAKPPEVVTREICAESGFPAAPECPKREEGRALKGASSPALCTLHRRGTGGEVVTRGDAYLRAFTGEAAKAERLAIRAPQDDAEFRLVPGLAQQRIVCTVVGNVPDGALWWFVDGAPVGETTGNAPFAWEPVAGAHVIACATADGVTASVRVRVTEDDSVR